MSVQKADILSFVNEKLLISETVSSIIDEINLVLDDLSKAKFPDLYRADVTADRVSLESGTTYAAEPTGLRVLDFIVINDGDNDGRPLTEISFEKWLKYREDENSGQYNEPEKFARRAKRFYFEPIPDDDYTAKFWYWRWHPATTGATEDILFGDEFDRVMKYGVCLEVAKTNKRTQDMDIWQPRYELEKAKILPQEDFKPALVKYRD